MVMDEGGSGLPFLPLPRLRPMIKHPCNNHPNRPTNGPRHPPGQTLLPTREGEQVTSGRGAARGPDGFSHLLPVGLMNYPILQSIC